MMSVKTSSSTSLRLVPVWLGLFGLLAMLVLGALNGRFMGWHYALGGLSLVSLFGGMAWLQDVRWKPLLVSLSYTIFFVLSVSLLYLISANRELRIDLTRDQVNSLRPQTEAVLHAIPAGDTVQLQLFAPEKEHAELTRFLRTYQREAPAQFRFDLFDPARDLDVVAKLGTTVDDGKMFVVRQDATGKIVRRTDGMLSAGARNREHIVTNALARLLEDEQQSIYFVTNHGERAFDDKGVSLRNLAKLIDANTLPVKFLRLSEGSIPEDAAVLVIAGPTSDLAAYEEEMLASFLDDGGKLMLMLDPLLPGQTKLEHFETLLNHVGVTAPDFFIVDPAAVSASSSPLTPLVGWLNHPISKGTNRQPFMLDKARPLDAMEKPPTDVKIEAVLITSQQVWAEASGNLRSLKRAMPPANAAEIGPQLAAFSISRPTRAGRYGETMRMVVVGDSDAFVNDRIDRNGEAALFVMQSINWMRERKELLQVPPRLLSSTPIFLTHTQVLLMSGGFLLAGLIISLGGTAYAIARRRTK